MDRKNVTFNQTNSHKKKSGVIKRDRGSKRSSRYIDYDRAVELPLLTKDDVDAYRCTMQHNVSRELLQAGYHKSFAFLRKLLRHQEAEAAAVDATASGEDWTRNLAKNSVAKLRIISEKLVEVENVYRVKIKEEMARDSSQGENGAAGKRHSMRESLDGNFSFYSVDLTESYVLPRSAPSYPTAPPPPRPSSVPLLRHSSSAICPPTTMKIRSIFLTLGACFELEEPDFWLAHRFFAEAVAASLKLPLHCDGPLGALSRQSLGRILIKRGKYAEAAAAFKAYYVFSKDRPWKNKDDVRCEVDASTLLARCLFCLSEKTENIEEKLDFSVQAFEAALRTKDRPLEDEAKIRLAKLKYDAEKFEEAEELAKDFAVFIDHRTPKDQALKAMEISARVAMMKGDGGAAVGYGVKWIEGAMEERMKRNFYEACLFLGSVCKFVNKASHADIFLRNAFEFALTCCRRKEKDENGERGKDGCGERGGGGEGGEMRRDIGKLGFEVRGLDNDGRLRRTPTPPSQNIFGTSNLSNLRSSLSTKGNGGGGGDGRCGVGWPRNVGEAEKARSKVEIGIHVGMIFDKTAAREMVGVCSIDNTKRMLIWKNDMKIPPQVEEEVDDRKGILLFGPTDGDKEKTTEEKEDADKGIDLEALGKSATEESLKNATSLIEMRDLTAEAETDRMHLTSAKNESGSILSTGDACPLKGIVRSSDRKLDDPGDAEINAFMRDEKLKDCIRELSALYSFPNTQ